MFYLMSFLEEVIYGGHLSQQHAAPFLLRQDKAVHVKYQGMHVWAGTDGWFTVTTGLCMLYQDRSGWGVSSLFLVVNSVRILVNSLF